VLADFAVAEQMRFGRLAKSLLGQVVANHRRGVGIDGLVVRDAGTDPVGERAVTGTENCRQTRNASIESERKNSGSTKSSSMRR